LAGEKIHQKVVNSTKILIGNLIKKIKLLKFNNLIFGTTFDCNCYPAQAALIACNISQHFIGQRILMMKQPLLQTAIAVTLFSAAAFSGTVAAKSQCSLQFNDDLLINQQEVQLQRAEKSLWRISKDGALWINDASVDTDTQTRQQLAQYQAGLRQSAADTVVLVTDAAELASTAITRVIQQFGVDGTEQQRRIDQSLQSMRTSINKMINQDGETIRIYGSKLTHLDQGFADELSAAAEQSMQDVAGNVLIMVGQALTSHDGNFEQRMAAFSQDMDQFSEQLDAELEQQSSALEQRGQQICSQLQQLDQLEQQIQAQVPAMAAHDLINNDPERTGNLTLSF